MDRPLSRDFLAGTPVRSLSDVDQYWTDDNGEIHLHNPQSSHSHNEGQGSSINPHSQNDGLGNFANPHGQNGNAGIPGIIELDGTGGNPHLGNGEAVLIRRNVSLAGNQNLLLREREPL